MKKILLFSSLFLLLFQFSALAQKGIVTIKITDDQKLNLPGATIVSTTLTRAWNTDNDGEAQLAGLPAGKHTIRITYIGYEDVNTEINVPASGTASLSFVLKPGITVQKEVIVLGDRLRGQARGLNQQKNNFNITNVVSADQIGRFPDANIGDAMKRIPGVTMQNDQGEARNIIIRGLSPELNSVTLNGDRIPSAEGDNRRVQMDLIPSDMIQTIQVNKTLTPDLDADAIGGSVNLVTRAAPNGLRISGTGSAIYNPIRGKAGYTGSFIAGNRFAKNKLGILLNGSINSNKYGSDDVEATWKEDDFGNVYTDEFEIRKYFVDRTRRSIGASIDFQPNTRTNIMFRSMYNWRDDWENRLRYTATDIEPEYDANDNITGYVGEVRRETKGGLNSDRVKSRRLEDQRAQNYSLKGDHIFGKGLKLDWSFGFSRASEERPHERYISFRSKDATVFANAADKRSPIVTDQLTASDFELREITEQFQDQYETEKSGRVNLSIPFTAVKEKDGFLKFGTSLRIKNKVRNNNFFEYAPVGSNEDNFENMGSVPTVMHSGKDFNPGSKYNAGMFVDPAYLGGLNLTNTGLFESEDIPAEYLAANYDAKEILFAGYAMWQQQWSRKLGMIAGLRFENTSSEYTGNVVEDEENLLGKQTNKNDYLNILPHLSFKYDITKNAIVRLAWTNSIARPNYYDLVPYFNVLPGDNELFVGNPNLKASRANNFDLMFENYYKSIGLISGGVFYKTVDQFMYVYRDENFTNTKFAAAFPDITPNPIPASTDWTFFQPRNGDNVQVYGFEVALQRQFDFLPGFWKGFGIYANYTYTKSKAKGIYNADGDLRTGLTLPGTAPHMVNASLSYENSRFLARVSANYTAAYIDELGGDAFEDRYYDKQFFLDLNASYAVTPRMRVFGEATNLTNQSLRYYQGVKDRTMQNEFYQPRYNFGVKFDLVK
ncbi:TonB-dependent receptor [Parasegetibacter sp. NRK P23]|uniref:TonB-dependent receptor n=1 Tax=Parasegetibacter sp. NRK P23 TaxID=2942999 RepID=UPI0020441154|nr:TonB-dependent receptor [Parasegetibacter sp. NRK P23]MCM5529122.1 TonB-dependent receptor [Parasegetibacter sp. NRK P23]